MYNFLTCYKNATIKYLNSTITCSAKFFALQSQRDNNNDNNRWEIKLRGSLRVRSYII